MAGLLGSVKARPFVGPGRWGSGLVYKTYGYGTRGVREWAKPPGPGLAAGPSPPAAGGKGRLGERVGPASANQRAPGRPGRIDTGGRMAAPVFALPLRCLLRRP